MNNPLRVSQCQTSSGLPTELELDDYIPLRFRTFREPIGCGLLRLGDYQATLMELKVELYSQVVRGLTLTSVALLSPWPSFEIEKRTSGLPALSTSFEGWSVVDLHTQFQVSVADEAILVRWATLDLCQACHLGETDFLVQDEIFAGVLFKKLRRDQLAQFLRHVPR